MTTIGATIVAERRLAVVEDGLARGRWLPTTAAAARVLACDMSLLLDGPGWERFLCELDVRVRSALRRSRVRPVRVG